MALLNLCKKFEMAKSILLKQYENGNKKKISITCPRVYAGKNTKRVFLKKPLQELNFLIVIGSYESLKGLKC